MPLGRGPHLENLPKQWGTLLVQSHLLAWSPGRGDLTFLCLAFLIHKRGLMMPDSQDLVSVKSFE